MLPPPPPAAHKRNLAAGVFYALLDINTSNLFLNFVAKLKNESFADVTFETIARNIYPSTWFWEDGDRFFVNQFGHPYQGSTYFGSARINEFSFYEAIPFALAGSIQWEIMLEPASGINDVISTVSGGIALGEMLHRLFLEVDASPSLGAKIGGFFVSPLESFNAVYNRPKRWKGGGNIYELKLNAGIEKSSAYFAGHETEETSWQLPGAQIGVNVIYGNPFIQKSKTPYNHFELNADITSNIFSYNMQILSDGYLFSFAPSAPSQKTFTSAGLTMHYDFFNATNDIIDNTGYGNIQFSSSAVDWTVKRIGFISERLSLSAKLHAGFTFWGASMYNGDTADDYWVNLGSTHGAYGLGENVKLFFTVSHKNWGGGGLELAAAGYHIFNMPVTPRHSKGNVFFLSCSLSCTIPLGKHFGIGARTRFWKLSGLYEDAENVNRRLVSSGLYAVFKF